MMQHSSLQSPWIAGVLMILLQTTLQLSPTFTAAFEFPSQLRTPWAKATTASRPAASLLLEQLEECINQAPRNGIDTPGDLEAQIIDLCESLAQINPTPKPVRNTERMNGFWKMRWTNFAPAAPSSGKLGPIVGNVYQDIDITNGVAKNIFQAPQVALVGELLARPEIRSDSILAISFVSVGNKIGGLLPLGPKKEFEVDSQIRLWEHVYLDDDYRILYARRPETKTTESKGFLYVMKRADEDRFETKI